MYLTALRRDSPEATPSVQLLGGHITRLNIEHHVPFRIITPLLYRRSCTRFLARELDELLPDTIPAHLWSNCE